jgi:hypothetical protein
MVSVPRMRTSLERRTAGQSAPLKAARYFTEIARDDQKEPTVARVAGGWPARDANRKGSQGVLARARDAGASRSEAVAHRLRHGPRRAQVRAGHELLR